MDLGNTNDFQCPNDCIATKVDLLISLTSALLESDDKYNRSAKVQLLECTKNEQNIAVLS